MRRRRHTQSPPVAAAPQARELNVLGSAYQGGKAPYRLRAREQEGEVAIAIHRPADRERASALIYIDGEASEQLARFLEERRG